jgi:hypothetical protein
MRIWQLDFWTSSSHIVGRTLATGYPCQHSPINFDKIVADLKQCWGVFDFYEEPLVPVPQKDGTPGLVLVQFLKKKNQVLVLVLVLVLEIRPSSRKLV